MIEKTAIILSGGKNSRMYSVNKAFLKINGERLIEAILRKASVFKEVLIVSNSPDEYQYLGVKVVSDIIPNCGPLSGIHAGLTHAQYHHSIVIPCDMPFITKEILAYLSSLAEGFDVVVPRINDEFEPLCGIYGKNCIEPIAECLEKSIFKIIRMYPMVRVRPVNVQEIKPFGDPEDLFRNINRPAEYMKYCLEHGSK